MNRKDLSPEQLEKAKACKTPEELFSLAQDEGIDLTPEELKEISGGGWLGHQCPQCGNYDVDMTVDGMICEKCGFGTVKKE